MLIQALSRQAGLSTLTKTDTVFLCVQLATLKELSKRLKKQLGREEAGGVHTRLKSLLRRRDRIKELAVKRQEELELHRMFCAFKQDVEEVREHRARLSSSALFRVVKVDDGLTAGRAVGV